MLTEIKAPPLDWGLKNNIPLNTAAEVTKDFHLPEKVLLHDTTLRDGEQFSGIELTKEEKVEIGKALSDYGIHRIEIMPAVSQEDYEAVVELNSMGLSSEIVGFCRSVQSDIDKSIAAGCQSIVLEIPSVHFLLKAMGWSAEDATGKMINMARYAKEQGLNVALFFIAITDNTLDFSERFVRTVMDAVDVDSVIIPDTFSKSLPGSIYFLTRKMKEWTGKPVEIHSHNALGMGTANALAGVMAGAEVVHVCVNGLGEGTGNASLDTVVVNLKMMLGIDTGVKFEKTYALSRLVERCTRLQLQANWPLCGERVFTTEAGVAVDFLTRMAESGVAPLEYDLATVIGRTRDVAVGKYSGSKSISVKMKRLGLPEVEKEVIDLILEQVKQKSIEKHDTLSDEEFKQIVSSFVST